MCGTSRCSTMRPLAASSSRHGAGHLHAARHRDVVGDRQQQRARLGVGVARPEHRLHLQGGPAGWAGSTHQQWYTTPSNTDRARIRIWWSEHGRCGGRRQPARRPGRRRRAARLRRRAGRRGGRRCRAGWSGRSPTGTGRGAATSRPAPSWPPGGTAATRRSPRSRHRCATLLAQDVDEQRSNPLAVVRRAVAPSHRRAPRRRRPAGRARRRTPSGCSPTTTTTSRPAAFADLDPSVHEPGLVWGAAKAHVILRRRRAEGRR